MTTGKQSCLNNQEFVVVRVSDGKVFTFSHAEALWDFAYDQVIGKHMEMGAKYDQFMLNKLAAEIDGGDDA